MNIGLCYAGYLESISSHFKGRIVQHLSKIGWLGCLAACLFLAGCQSSRSLEFLVINQGEDSVQLRSEDETGYMQLSPGGKAYIHTNSWRGERKGGGFAFIGEGGAGVKSLPDSTLWVDGVEVRLGEGTEILNTGFENVSIQYAKAGVGQRTLVLGPSGSGTVDASQPFQLNGLHFSELNQLDD